MMSDVPVTIAKGVADFGGVGVLAIGMGMLYRLADKWGMAFIEAQREQTRAMVQQACAVTQLVQISEKSSGQQGEVLIAVRMLADRMDVQRQCLQMIDQFVREREGGAAARERQG
jgi:hypothetical protein